MLKLCNRIGLALALGLSGVAHAAGWNEAVDGDLSNTGLAPSVLTLNAGLNPLRGSFGAPDRDYLVVDVPQGLQLTALRYGAGMVLGGPRAFIGVQAGPVMTVPHDTETAAGLLGWAHVQDAAVGTNLLPDIGRGFGALGFSGPLPAGSYTLWIQETLPEPGLSFSFDLEVTAVPEPASAWLLLCGLGGFAFRAASRLLPHRTRAAA